MTSVRKSIINIIQSSITLLPAKKCGSIKLSADRGLRIRNFQG